MDSKPNSFLMKQTRYRLSKWDCGDFELNVCSGLRHLSKSPWHFMSCIRQANKFGNIKKKKGEKDKRRSLKKTFHDCYETESAFSQEISQDNSS